MLTQVMQWNYGWVVGNGMEVKVCHGAGLWKTSMSVWILFGRV